MPQRLRFISLSAAAITLAAGCADVGPTIAPAGEAPPPATGRVDALIQSIMYKSRVPDRGRCVTRYCPRIALDDQGPSSRRPSC